MKTAFMYSDEFEDVIYRADHPLKPARFKLAYELAKSYGLFGPFHHRVIKAKPCAVEDLLLAHSVEYVEAVEHAAEPRPEWDLLMYGLGTNDTPLPPQIYEWSRLSVGASMQAAKLVESGEADVAFNIAGGQHHAFRNRASGFCYFNDAAVIIQWFLNKGYERVAYVDIDAHHGDGVQQIFYRTDRVLTISLHETGFSAFPGTGFEREIGEEEGTGYSVNVPLLAGSDDDVFWYAFNEVVPPLLDIFRPDVLITQLGVDTFCSDPLAKLNVTTHGYCRVIEEFKRLSPGKWVALGGGGYNQLNVPRAWTLAWAIMCGVGLPNHLPRHYQKLLKKYQIIGEEDDPPQELRDQRYRTDLATKIHFLIELEKTVSYIKSHQMQQIRPCASDAASGR